VSTQTVQMAGVAAMPRVNLMPPEIAEAARFRQLQMVMGGAVALSVVVVVLLHMHAKSGVTSAENGLTASQTQHAVLEQQLNGLSQVQDTYNQVQAKQQMLQQAMGYEIRWSYVLNDLSLTLPPNVWLTSMAASEYVPGNTTAATGTSTGLGTISFSGVGAKHDDVANWLDVLAKERGFTDPTFSNSTEGSIGSQSTVTFGTTANLDNAALSNRFVQKAGN
jgi:Tfp pilus assembly protein PilN